MYFWSSSGHSFDWLSRNISNSMRWPHTWLTNNVTWYGLGRYCGWNMGANNKVTIEKKMMSKPYCTRKTFHRFLSNNSCRIRLVSYVRAVTKFCRCQVCVITGWRTKQLGGSFGSLSLFFIWKYAGIMLLVAEGKSPVADSKWQSSMWCMGHFEAIPGCSYSFI